MGCSIDGKRRQQCLRRRRQSLSEADGTNCRCHLARIVRVALVAFPPLAQRLASASDKPNSTRTAPPRGRIASVSVRVYRDGLSAAVYRRWIHKVAEGSPFRPSERLVWRMSCARENRIAECL